MLVSAGSLSGVTSNQIPPVSATATPKKGCLSVLVGVVVMSVICGGLLFGAVKVSDFLSSQDEWAERPGTPVPSPTSSEPPDKGEGVEFGIEDLAGSLKARVVRSAGVVKPTTSKCHTELVQPTFTCTVIYDGEEVTYNVKVDVDNQGGWSTWEAHTDSLVMTREGVLAAVWRRFGQHTKDLRCADGIPEKARVAPNTELPQRCYFLPTKDHPSFRAEDDLRTREVRIVIIDGRISPNPHDQ